MRTLDPREQSDHDISDKIYSQDRFVAGIAAFLIMVTNLFWFFLYIFNINLVRESISLNLENIYVKLTMVTMILYCGYIIFLRVKDYNSQLLTRISLIIFSFLICLEVFVLCVNKNMVSASQNFYVNGISLSTLYVFILIFITLPNFLDSCLVAGGIFLCIFLPKFMPGSGVYSLTQNMVLAFCVIVAYFTFRHLIQIMAKQTINYSHECELYHTLTVQSIATIANTIDAKDFYTHGHSRRVGEYSRELAKRLGLGLKDQEEIYFAGLLHDVGKISTPREILNKPTRLTDDEFAIIKKHPVEGYNILKELKIIPSIAQAARWHHERVDGRGYPDGIRGDDLPIYAKIISVADSYDAMASDRPYRPNLSTDYIVSELKKGRGSQFDPLIAEKMLEMIADGSAPIILENVTHNN